MLNKTLLLRHSNRGLQASSTRLISTRVFEARTEDGAAFVVSGDDVEAFLNNNGFEVFPTGMLDGLIDRLRVLSDQVDKRDRVIAYLDRYFELNNLEINDNPNLRTDSGSCAQPDDHSLHPGRSGPADPH